MRFAGERVGLGALVASLARGLDRTLGGLERVLIAVEHSQGLRFAGERVGLGDLVASLGRSLHRPPGGFERLVVAIGEAKSRSADAGCP